MIEYAPNFESVQRARVVSMPARIVPMNVWAMLQRMQRSLVHAQLIDVLPEDTDQYTIAAQALRADEITRLEDRPGYIDRRVHPNRYKGENGANTLQLYRKTLATLVFGGPAGQDLLGGVGTNRNTSSSIPGAVGATEQRIKMYAHPSVPRIGGHRYEKITDAFFKDEPAAALLGLHRVLRKRPLHDQAVLYHTVGDAADKEMGWLANTVGLELRATKPNSEIRGYPNNTEVGRYTAEVGTVLENIEALPGATEAIESAHYTDTVPFLWRT
jgi:hypothetical protein